MSSQKVVDIVQRLLEHRADADIRNRSHSTSLHQALSSRWLEVPRLLLSYGASVDAQDGVGGIPFQVASSGGQDEYRETTVRVWCCASAVAYIGFSVSAETYHFHTRSLCIIGA